MSQAGRLSATRALGRGIVKYMPAFMTLISTIGTAAMLWVGGSIILHGLEVLGWPWLYETIHHAAEAAAHAVPVAQGLVAWAVTATLDGIFGVALGLILIPVATRIIGPAIAAVTGKKKAAH